MKKRPKPQKQPKVTVPRDAEETRKRLVSAAIRQFVAQGYAATTVREIAREAGVDAALINRYFESKEGLLSATIVAAEEQLLRSASLKADLMALPQHIAIHATTTSSDEPELIAMRLLLRATGDPNGEALRLGVLRRFSEALASLAGTGSGADAVLRSQVIIAIGVGVAALRASGVEPLASGSPARLAELMQQLVNQLLHPTTQADPSSPC